MGRHKLPKAVKLDRFSCCVRAVEVPIMEKAMDIIRLRRNCFLLGDRQEAINQLIGEFSEMVRV